LRHGSPERPRDPATFALFAQQGPQTRYRYASREPRRCQQTLRQPQRQLERTGPAGFNGRPRPRSRVFHRTPSHRARAVRANLDDEPRHHRQLLRVAHGLSLGNIEGLGRLRALGHFGGCCSFRARASARSSERCYPSYWQRLLVTARRWGTLRLAAGLNFCRLPSLSN